MVLYDVPVGSADPWPSRGLKVLWALHEAGVSFEFRATYPRQGRVPPEFPTLNPLGQVPALAAGDLSLSEASAIIVYVAKKCHPALYPFDTPEEQARADRLLYFATTTLEVKTPRDSTRSCAPVPPPLRNRPSPSSPIRCTRSLGGCSLLAFFPSAVSSHNTRGC